MNLKKHVSTKLAFTLAETLITLGIIGVVAAITLPVLTGNYQQKVFETQRKKFASEMSQASKRAMYDNNAVSLVETPLVSSGGIYLLKNYLKTIKFCDAQNADNCFTNKYINSEKEIINLEDIVNGESTILNDGTAVYMSEQCSSFGTNGAVDLNGKQGPNIIGKDLLYFSLLNDGTVMFYDSPFGGNLVLVSSGNQKVQVIKAVREITGLGLKDAKALVDNVPSVIKEGVKREEMKALQAKFENLGATVEFR